MILYNSHANNYYNIFCLIGYIWQEIKERFVKSIFKSVDITYISMCMAMHVLNC